MKKQVKFLTALLTVATLTGCSGEGKLQAIDQRQGQLELIQSNLRAYAVESWEANLPRYKSADDLPLPSEIIEPAESTNYDQATITWRNEIGEAWTELQGQKNLDLMCQYWFEGWLGLSDRFADTFKEYRARTDAMGVKIETIENIRMAEDNRKTINYPKPGQRKSLFTCEATTIFRLARPGLTKPARSTISFVYKLENNEVKASFSVTAGLSTVPVQ